MALSNFSDKQFTSSSPAVKGRPYIDGWSISGTSVSYSINFSAHATSAGAWRNNPWYVSIWLDSTNIANHKKVKNKTSGKIGTTVYYMSKQSSQATGTYNWGSSGGTVKVYAQMFDNWSYTAWTKNVWDWTTYAVYYAANGGSSTPNTQTKYSGTALTLAAAISHADGTANGYTVTFDANGGSVSPTTKTATDTIGYSFSSWKADNGTTYSGGGSYTTDAATTMTAQWSTSVKTRGSITTPSATRSNGTSTITVTFNANGGSTTKGSQNSTATVTYTANGWYTATSGGTKRCDNGGSYTPGSSETVHQQWGSSTGSFSAVTLPTTSQCTRTGYTLLGWSASSTATSATWSPGASYTPDTTKTIYAVWKINTYTVTVWPGGGTYDGSTSQKSYTQNYNTTKAMGQPTPPTGHIFAGYYAQGSLSGIANNEAIFEGGTGQFAVYNNSGNGTVTHSRVQDNTVPNVSMGGSSTGYKMVITKAAGTASPGCGGFVTRQNTAANQKYIQIVWAKIPVGFRIEHASNSVGNSPTWTWVTETQGTGNWYRYACTLQCSGTGTFQDFGYMYLIANDGNNSKAVTWEVCASQVTNITNSSSTTYTFNATRSIECFYAPLKYTITYNANGGSGAPDETVYTYATSGTTNLSSTIPTRDGYNFLGWSQSSTATTASYSAGQAWNLNNANNYNLYAVWQLKTYTVAYAANGGSSTPSSQTKTWGVNLTLASAITRSNSTSNFTIIPDTYKRLLYVESSGNQWIDIGINPNTYNSRLKVEGEIQWTTTPGGWTTICGSCYGDNAGTWSWTPQFNLANNGDLFIAAELPTGTAAGSAQVTLTTSIKCGTSKHNIIWDVKASTQVITVDGFSAASASGAIAGGPNANLYLFGRNYLNPSSTYPAGSFGSSIKMYSFKITDNNTDTVLRNLVPCIRVSDNVAGLYDTVNSVFYSSGSGTALIAGPETGYGVFFNGNNGTISGSTSAVSQDTTSYAFYRWESSADASLYTGGGTYSIELSTRMFARWTETISHGSVTLPTAAQCVRPGYRLLGFSTSSSATSATYNPGASYTPTGTITLYAIWELDQATVWYKNSAGVWVKGKVWYKNSSGTWVKAKKFYVKSNDAWIENKTTS